MRSFGSVATASLSSFPARTTPLPAFGGGSSSCRSISAMRAPVPRGRPEWRRDRVRNFHSSGLEAAQGCKFGALVAAGVSVHLLQKLAHRIELGAEALPISGLQSLHCLIVAIERLLCRTWRGALEGHFLRRSRACRHCPGLYNQRRQGLRERLLHHHMFTVGCDHTFQLLEVY